MFVIFFLLWLIFNGRVTWELVLIGLGAACIAWLFAYRIVGYTIRTDLRMLKNIPWLLRYVANLLVEIVKSALEVGRVALTPGLRPDPVFVEFHSGFQSEFCNVLLADSITLTPGTITVYQEGDFFVIHCLRREYAEGIENSSFIRLIRQMK